MNESAVVPSSNTPLLRMERISKRFGLATVLNDVSLDLFAGEVHALLGCNGAGKSTLLKILAGVHSCDRGRIVLEGQTIVPRSPSHAAKLGIAVIHQELSLVPALSVTENLLLGRPISRFGFLSRRQERAEAERLLERVALDIDPDKPIETLSLADRQLVEIAKALGLGARVLVMDEPTSALTAPSVDKLFELVRSLCAASVAVVYVSHRMEEIERLAQRLTVLRDGRVVGQARVGEARIDEIVSWMLGPRAEVEVAPPLQRAETVTNRLEVEHFTISSQHHPRPLVDDVSFTVAAGEVVGCFGLSGAGSSDIVAGLFGVSGDRAKGHVRMDGAHVTLDSPASAAALGIGFVPADRKGMGIIPQMSSAKNATLAHLRSVSPRGWIRGKRDEEMALLAAEKTGLNPRSLDLEIAQLSGGNQQKVVLGKWLVSDPRLLLLDDPTRGVDVGAKAEIYARLRHLASCGASVLVSSSDAQELVELCNRILVFRYVKIVANVRPSESGPDRLVELAMLESPFPLSTERSEVGEGARG